MRGSRRSHNGIPEIHQIQNSLCSDIYSNITDTVDCIAQRKSIFADKCENFRIISVGSGNGGDFAQYPGASDRQNKSSEDFDRNSAVLHIGDTFSTELQRHRSDMGGKTLYNDPAACRSAVCLRIYEKRTFQERDKMDFYHPLRIRNHFTAVGAECAGKSK